MCFPRSIRIISLVVALDLWNGWFMCFLIFFIFFGQWPSILGAPKEFEPCVRKFRAIFCRLCAVRRSNEAKTIGRLSCADQHRYDANASWKTHGKTCWFRFFSFFFTHILLCMALARFVYDYSLHSLFWSINQIELKSIIIMEYFFSCCVCLFCLSAAMQLLMHVSMCHNCYLICCCCCCSCCFCFCVFRETPFANGRRMPTRGPAATRRCFRWRIRLRISIWC